MREPYMSPKPLRRWYRLKWAGLAASLAVLIVLLAEPIQLNSRNTAFWVFNGSAIVFYQPVGPGVEDDVWHNWKVGFANNVWLLPQYRTITPRTGKLMWISLPLRPLLLFLLIATLILWRLDRRFSPGCCQKCGYNLTGNVSGVCPECGEKLGGDSSSVPAKTGS